MQTNLESRMKELLHNTLCVVEFIKVNGETRRGTFTLKENYINENVEKKENKTDRVVPDKSGTIRAVDTNLNEWRSFIVSNVTSFSYLDTYTNTWVSVEI